MQDADTSVTWPYSINHNALKNINIEIFFDWLEDNIGRLGFDWLIAFDNDITEFVYYFKIQEHYTLVINIE